MIERVLRRNYKHIRNAVEGKYVDLDTWMPLIGGIVIPIMIFLAGLHIGKIKERKHKGEELISLLNTLNRNLIPFTKLEPSSNEYAEDCRDYEEVMVKVETMAKLHSSKRTFKNVQTFLGLCEGIRLNVEIDHTSRRINELDVIGEEIKKGLSDLENSKSELVKGDNISGESLELYLKYHEFISQKKIEMEDKRLQSEKLKQSNIEKKFRLRKLLKTDSLEELIKMADISLETACNSILNDHKLSNWFRINK